MHLFYGNEVKRRSLWLLACLLLSGPVAWAQRPASLRGTVADSLSGQPLPGVHVELLGQPGRGATTDALGQFQLRNLAAGTYQVRLGALGYRARQQAVTLVAGETRGVQTRLATTSLNLAEVTVGQPADPNQTLAAISHIDQTLRPINSAQDLLRLVPGLFIAQHAGGGKAEQIFIRGFDADHGTDFAVSLDGLPVNMVSHAHGQGYADFHFVIPETVEQLKVYKGPYTARFGDFATAGAGEFSTKNSLDHSQVKLEVGQFNTYRALAMVDLLGSHHLFSQRPENAYVAAEYNFTNSYFDNPQHFKRFNGLAKYVGQLSERTSLTLFGSYFTSSWDASGQIPERAVQEGLISRFGSIDPSEGGNTNRSNAYATLTTALPHDATLRQQVYYSRYYFNLYSNFTFFKNDPVNGDEIDQRDTGRNLWGYTGTYDRTDYLGSKALHSTLGLGTRIDNGGLLLRHAVQRRPLDTLSIGRLYEQNINAYLDETLELTDRLTVNAAVRGDVFVFDFRGQRADSMRAPLGPFGGRVVRGRVSPKLNLYYQLSPAVQLFARSGLGFHSNDARGVVQGAGSFNALPRATGAEVGASTKPLSSLVLSAALWTLHLQDELVYSGDEGTTESVGPTRRYGVDVSARWQLLPWLFADGDFNYSHGRLVNAPEGENYIPLAPTFTSTGGLSVRTPKGLGASLRYRHIDNRPAQEDNAIRARGYFLLDAVLNYTRPRYQVGLQAQNLLNAKWNEAQFATDSQLRGEARSVNELNFTPGTPLFIKLNGSIFF